MSCQSRRDALRRELALQGVGKRTQHLEPCFLRCLKIDARICALRPQCRLEANYAHQQELDMIPLMMQKDYAPKGWRKIVTMQSVAFATMPFSGQGCHRRAIGLL